MSAGGPTNAAAQVKLAYQGVIDDVVKSVRELFLNDGVDEQVLADLKEIWEAKLEESGVMDHPPPLIPKHKVPGEVASKHYQQSPQQHSWSLHQHQPQHQHQSPQHRRHYQQHQQTHQQQHQQQLQQQHQHHQQQQQQKQQQQQQLQQQQQQKQQQQQQQQKQQAQSLLPPTTSTVGSHNPPTLTSISTTLSVPSLVTQVTTAEASTSSSSSTTESSTAQSTAALLQSSIASAAATGSVLPNLQYMISGSAQGTNPGYTLILDPQTRLPVMVPLATVANIQMAKQLQALQQQTAAAVAAAARSGSSISSSSAAQQFSVIQNPALSAMAAAMGGDVTVAASAASQQNKTSQSQSSTDSSQVDGTQPIIMDNDMTFSANQVLCDPDKRSALHKNFQTVKSKQLLQDCFSDSVNDVSGSVAAGEVNFDPSADCNAMELLEPYDVTTKSTHPTTGGTIPQLDGANQESSEEEESEDSEDEDDAVNQDAAEGDDDPLNSGDDDDSLKSDDEDKFETENIIVCQFDKVTRTRIGGKNRWKFHLKDGIMNLDGRDYVFQKATGEADW